MYSQSKNSFGFRGFQRFDLFGTPLQIRFNNFQMHKTYFGCFVTIIILILLLLYSYQIIIDCLTYARPNVVFQENSVELPSAFELTPKKFTLAMGIQDQQNLVHFIDEKIYFLEVILKETSKVLNNSTKEYEQVDVSIPVKMIPCSIQNFQVEGTQEYFTKLKYQNLYCFPIDSNLKLEGQFGAIIYRRLIIRVRSCEQNCVDEETLKKRLSNFAFQIYYVNYAVKSTDKKNPFKAIGQNTFWQSGYSLFKNINVYFRKTRVNSDFGLFLQDLNSDERLLYSFDRETLVTKTDNKMFEMFINLEKNKESEYIRTYTKIQYGFSQIGGIFNILFCLGCLICYPFSRSSLEKNLMNKIFNFKETRERKLSKLHKNSDVEISHLNQIKNQRPYSPLQNRAKQDSNLQNRAKQDSSNIIKNNVMTEQVGSDRLIYKSVSLHQQLRDQRLKRFSFQNQSQDKQQRQKTDSLNEIPNQNSMQSSKNLANLINQNQEQQQQQRFQSIDKIHDNKVKIHTKFTNKLSDVYNTFKITMVNLIGSKISNIFRRNQPYTRMINYGIEKLYSQLDIEYIMNKLIEIEKLKHLLLNENQIKLFEFIPKPTIYLSDFENQDLEQKIRLLTSKLKNSTNPDKVQTNSQPRFSLLTEDNHDVNQKAKEAEEAFYQIFKVEKNVSRVDQKLIELLDPDLINLLEVSARERTPIKYRQDSHHTSEKLISHQTQPIEKFIVGHNTSIYDNELFIKDHDQDQETNEYKSEMKYYPSDLKSYKLLTKNNSLRFS